MKEKKSIYILIAVLVCVVILLSVKLVMAPSSMPNTTESLTPTATEPTVSLTEQEAIETWIKTSDLNFFGDPQDTVYTGGTPLYDETTGETQDRFEYIVENHPDKPWNN